MEMEVRTTIDSLAHKLDKLDTDAELLQESGFEETLKTDPKESAAKLEVLEKSLAEAQEEVERIRSNLQVKVLFILT